MSTSLWLKLGDFLGDAYFIYTFGLWLGCLGPHVLLLLGYFWSVTRKPGLWIHTALELIYGLLNPVLYLLVFEPALLRSVSSVWLAALCWSLLIGYWGLRLIGRLLPIPRESLRSPIRLLLTACMGLVLIMGLRDLFSNPTGPWYAALGLSPLFPLYLMPIAIAERQRRWTRDAESWTRTDAFFLSSALSRVAVVLGVLGVVLMCLAAVWRPSERTTRELLLAHRDDILSASARANVDPRLVASILFVIQREHTTPFHSALEETVAGAWLVDPTSHALISKALDPSLGLAQIKPKTMLTALWIRRASDGVPGMPNKHYRDVPDEGDAHQRIPSPGLRKVQHPVISSAARKPEVVQALLDPKQGIALCAFLLDLYATQWETANADWGIRHQPDILATLYQIGFQRSHPKADPRPNAFGQRVREVFDEPWMREHFAPQ
ncbi:hypothetical protein [Vitiosangium sp. GDMCC 1.1324]|uniref:hypothetical protein n=1 Tax=Vitiosangium sp. (strain GDMCC 1.1324) TaxID=2138576 RepID=UPI000D3356FA|nr:hypothetical protein [Vitiosangium sp. GDMCC 1.1324]PTL76017.1 hypothetical protein DAT35_51770 [Vitiosangium sp. GDMCC 1.1324]